MITPDDLIDFALELVRDAKGAESAATRAVSAAYYALFHTITQAGAALFREARVRADYDLAWALTWSDAEELVWLALEACRAFREIRTEPATTAFLIEPLLRDRNRVG